MKSLGLHLISYSSNCTVANGQQCSTLGYITTPIALMNKIHLIDILVVPEISQKLILGIDFWKSMSIVPNLNENVWHFIDKIDSIELTSDQGLLSQSSLTIDQKHRLNGLISEKLDLMGNNLGFCTAGSHLIELLPGTKPIKQRYYPVNPHKQKIINEEVDSMLSQGVIEESRSAWSSPICLVQKKDGQYRFCIDFRQLNAVTKKDAYPIPYISSILDQLRNAKYLSSLDIKSAYFQIPLSPESKELTAFTVPGRGLFNFTRMAFGLTNAPATWQRIIDSVLGVDLQPSVFVYLDDVVIVSQDFESHLETLSIVFDRLTAAGLVVSQEKCKFCLPQLKYLGYVVDEKGLHPDPDKVEAIINVSSPKNINEIRRFIGTASWYRRFIPNFSSIMAPLTRLTQKSVKWNWSKECEDSFRILKEKLISSPILTCPDFNRTFILQCDSSSYGIGCCLVQEFPEGEKVICFLSRSLTKQEKNYSTTELEALAVIWSIEKLRHYVEHTHFKVITDHYSLLWLQRLKDPKGRLARWVLRLQPYDFEIIHRPGKLNIVPDFLSRAVPVDSVEVTPCSVFPDTKDRWYNNMLKLVADNPDKFPAWRVENNTLFKYVKSKIPELSSESDFWKIVVPKDKRKDILQRCHCDVTAGHFGSFKTFWKIRNKYYWPKMQADIITYVRSCKICAEYKPEQKAPAGLMGSRPNINQPWQMISLDFIGPLPRSTRGYQYCLVVTDYFSKYVLIFALRTANAASLVRCVEEDVFLVYGSPQYLVCDNGTPMKSHAFQTLCKKYKTVISYTAAYLPRADPTERVNRVVKTLISSYTRESHRNWDKHIASIACAIRTAKHETVRYTPYFINFGREYKLYGQDFIETVPVDSDLDPSNEVSKRQEGFRKVFQDVTKRLISAHQRSKKVYDLRRRDVEFTPGQKVWKKNKTQSDALNYYSAKLAPKFVGPFSIARKVGYATYELIDDNGISKGIWHAQDLKPDFTINHDNFPT